MIKRLLLFKFWLFSFFAMYAQSGTPVLEGFVPFNEGQAFSTITVDANNNVWAGTSKAGVFMLNQQAEATQFSLQSLADGSFNIQDYDVQCMGADGNGNLWIGHAGLGGARAPQGGIERVDINTLSVKHYSPDRDAKCFTYLQRDGLGTANAKSITVDVNNTIWVAHRYHDLLVTGAGGGDYIITPGTFSFKRAGDTYFDARATDNDIKSGNGAAELPYPAYTCNPPIDKTPQSRSFSAIGSDSTEVWVSHFPYVAADEVTSYPARILRYDLDGAYLGEVHFATMDMPTGGIFNSIYLSPKGHKWVSNSFTGKGFSVYKAGVWTYVSSLDIPCIFPEGTRVNDNGIWGNKFGNVFIGTNKGLIVYNGRGPVLERSSYTFFSTATHTDMISDNITGGFSENDSIQWMATDNGIMRRIIGRYDVEDGTGKPNGLGARENDYTSCDNDEMEEVETALSDPNAKNNRSYHIYRIETEVCRMDGPNGNLCTAENIYKMMMEDINLTVVNPYDFPLDGFTKPFLEAVTASDLDSIENNVNNWVAGTYDENPEAGEIRYIRDILPRQALKEILESNGWQYNTGYIPSLAFINKLVSRKGLYDEQMEENSKKAVACEQYNLYNSPNFIEDRQVFAFGNYLPWILGCDEWNGLEDVEYDPVYVYPDPSTFTITNYTADGHMLYPGKITRQVIETCESVKVITIGEGLQFCGDNSTGRNNSVANEIGGLILFKNVDFRLIKAFEEL